VKAIPGGSFHVFGVSVVKCRSSESACHVDGPFAELNTLFCGTSYVGLQEPGVSGPERIFTDSLKMSQTVLPTADRGAELLTRQQRSHVFYYERRRRRAIRLSLDWRLAHDRTQFRR